MDKLVCPKCKRIVSTMALWKGEFICNDCHLKEYKKEQKQYLEELRK